MGYSFLIIGEKAEETWPSIVRRALSSLGESTIIDEAEVEAVSHGGYDAIVIDAGAVREVPSLMARLRAILPGVPIVVATASPTWTRAREAFKAGAAEYVRKSLDEAEIRAHIGAVLEAAPPAKGAKPTRGLNDKGNDPAG